MSIINKYNFLPINQFAWILTVLLIVFQFSAAAQSADQILKKTIEQEAFENARLGIYIKNITQNKVILAHEIDKRLIPASTLKVKTAAGALTTYGALHRFPTSVFLIGEVNQGVFYGDIVLKGFGDPTFNSDMTSAVSIKLIEKQIAVELKRLEIQCVYGQVVVDASYFSLPAVPSGYLQEDIANYYGAGAFGFNIQDNAYKITLHRGRNNDVTVSGFDSLAIDFATANVRAIGNSDQAYIYYHPEDRGVHIIGEIPVGTGAFGIKGAIKNPPLYAARLLQKNLMDQGIEFQKRPVARWMPYVVKKEIIFKEEYASPPLIDILKVVLHKSNNVYAEVLHRHLIKDSKNETSETLLDGSGLSPENRISPAALMEQLEAIATSPYFADFLSVMPRNGKDGTVRSIVKNKPSTLYLKSGSIGGVRCYIGFRKSKNGDWLGLVCMANDLTSTGSQSRRAWETMLSWVSDL